MAYKVIYDDSPDGNRRKRRRNLTLLFLGLFLGWTVRSWEEGRELLCSVMLPGRLEDAAAVCWQRLSCCEDLREVAAVFLDVLSVGKNEIVY